MNKEKLREKILTLSDLTTEEKSALLELINRKKKYGLVWEEKPEKVEEQLREQIPVLKEVKELAIVNDPDTDKYPDHILIEGDNLHALTALSYTHEGKIDVIYIDPPYNTGNKDFVYNDSYVDKEDSYRHSKWLSFMEKRLKLAKRMLSERGVIFISIDDNEVAQLTLLCDSIFNEKNRLATVVQKSRDSISGDLIFSPNHNYLLVYAFSFDKIFKKKDSFRIPSIVDEAKYKNPDNDPRGPWKLNPVDGPGGARKGNPFYNFLGIEGYYRYSKDTMQLYFEQNLIVKRKNSLGKKYFLTQALEKKGDVPTTWWDDTGTTTSGTKLLKSILPDKLFNNPKPIDLIKRCLHLASSKDSVILDFFAGSGTTLHATMQLNADVEDGGNRQCILVTNNENNICTDVTYERNKRVIEGYTTPKGEEKAGLSENNLRYYKAEFLPRTKTLRNKRTLLSAATDLLCIKEGNYAEKEMFGSIECNEKGCRYFRQGKKQMLVIYDESLIDAIIAQLSAMEVEEKIKIYVFAPGMYPFTDDFLDVYDKIELCALPDAIYKAYQSALPKTAGAAYLSEDAEDSMRQSERLLNTVSPSLFETLN